ncbi:O-antigen ligase family protein [Roseivirga sp. 4D4]|uniref:O-antigen ligase family protein n=1 Tax=Roseivirga sp. 4D4 TaxID=1889784 RepID=UPI001112CC1E|nr:O-antigen ligase family protein [Roseivirga sp. 4D4]
MDKTLFLFTLIAIAYAILPVGEAAFINKIVYLKNVLLIPVFYLFGRNTKLTYADWNTGFKLFLGLTLVTTIVVVFEKMVGYHLHAFIDSALYHREMKDIDLKGVFGIGYTFEAQGGKPRYASLYANPLELSASMLLLVSYTIYQMVNSKNKTNKLIYFFFLVLGLLSLLFAYSRATFLAFFVMLVFVAFQLKYYRIILSTFVLASVFGLYFMFLASDELRYFVIDTITFQNSSSLTHVLDWLEAIDSMINNPFGIGLGTSGNVGGVESDLIVGGENQFLIYGVQMGFLGAFIYFLVLFLGIKHCFAYQRTLGSNEEKMVPFIAASVKFGLLLPLLTANVEAYLFISLVTWWMIGHGEDQYIDSKKHVQYSNPMSRLKLKSD